MTQWRNDLFRTDCTASTIYDRIYLAYRNLKIEQQTPSRHQFAELWPNQEQLSTTPEIINITEFFAQINAVTESIIRGGQSYNTKNTAVLQDLDKFFTALQKAMLPVLRFTSVDRIFVWLRGRILVMALHSKASWIKPISTWDGRFRKLGITPQTYTIQHFLNLNVVYIMLCPSSKKVYIGSTSVTMTGRNSSRKSGN